MINQRDFKKNPNFIHTFAAKELGMYSRVDKTAGIQTDFTIIIISCKFMLALLPTPSTCQQQKIYI